MPLADPRDAHMTSLHDTDKVIGIYSGSFTAGPIVGSQPTFTEQLQDSGFSETCLTHCVYRVDGGEWQDDGSFDQAAFLIQAASYSKGGQVSVIAGNIDTSSHLIEYKLLALAKEGQGDITPITTAQPSNYDFINTNSMKVFTKGVQSIVTSGSYTPSQFTVNHNLGYVPTSRVHYEYADEIWSSPMIGMNNPSVVDNTANFMDSLVVAFIFIPGSSRSIGGQTVKLHYTVYYDD